MRFAAVGGEIAQVLSVQFGFTHLQTSFFAILWKRKFARRNKNQIHEANNRRGRIEEKHEAPSISQDIISAKRDMARLRETGMTAQMGKPHGENLVEHSSAHINESAYLG